MSTIDKKKFQFVERDDFASETIDAPSYSYWKEINHFHVSSLGGNSLDEFCLSNVFKL